LVRPWEDIPPSFRGKAAGLEHGRSMLCFAVSNKRAIPGSIAMRLPRMTIARE
jgi:hypothetical protein